MKIDATSNGAIGFIHLMGSESGKIILGYRVEIYTSNGTKYAKLVEINKAGKDGKTISGLPVGEWFDLTIEFYPYFYEEQRRFL